MAKKLTDLSQLTKAILKESPPSRVEPAPAAQPAPTVSDEDREAEEVLAYFSRTPQNAPRSPRVAPGAGAGENRTAELKAALEAKDAALDAIAEEKAEADERIAELEQQLAAEREAHEAAIRERDRWQGECGRLQGELRKKGENAPVVAPVVAAPVPNPSRRSPLGASSSLLRRLPRSSLARCASKWWRRCWTGSERRSDLGGNAAPKSCGVCWQRISRRANLSVAVSNCGRF